MTNPHPDATFTDRIPATSADDLRSDPYHVLITENAVGAAGAARAHRLDAQHRIERAQTARARRDAIIAAAADLDPADHSDYAEHTREVAEQSRDHNQMQDRRIAWAVAALHADPALAQRMAPEIRHQAQQLLAAEQADLGTRVDLVAADCQALADQVDAELQSQQDAQDDAAWQADAGPEPDHDAAGT